MANERRSEVPTGSRNLELKDHIREVEKAAADWGVHVDALEGRFIGALLAAILESGRTNLAVLGDIEALLERARATGEGELRRIGLMIEASQRTLSMAQEAAETSAVAGERAERVFNASVAKIAKELSVKLLDECQQWLVLKQTRCMTATAARSRCAAFRSRFPVASRRPIHRLALARGCFATPSSSACARTSLPAKSD